MKNDIAVTDMTAADAGGSAAVHRLFYPVVSALTMLIHFMYLVMFFSEGLYFMAGVNVFSVLIYLVGIVYISKSNKVITFMQTALLEIIVHAVLATLFAGWDYGFQMFLICMLPVPYMLSLKSKNLMHIISVSILMTFIILKLVCVSTDIKKELSADPTGWYIFNSFMSFVVIIVVTNNFMNKNLSLNLALAKQNADLQKAASTDSLTGLFNRRAMNEPFRIACSNENGNSVALLDIDYFKKINDTYGHDAGDMALVRISEIVMADSPSEACICRWGGEEILILLPGVSKKRAAETAQKICTDVADENFEWEGKRFSITVTIGVSYSPKGVEKEQTIRMADNRLYRGKADGRNRIVVDDT